MKEIVFTQKNYRFTTAFSANRTSWLLCALLSVFCLVSSNLHAQITISTIAGNGSAGYTGDGGPATTASVYTPNGVTADGIGNIYISDPDKMVVRKVDPSGIITTIAGTGVMGLSGDGGPATAARLYAPTSTVIDMHGNIYIADQLNCRIRKIDASGIMSTFAGSTCGNTGNGGPATIAQIGKPQQMAISPAGDLYFVDGYYHGVRKISSSGIISAVAGIGTLGYSGDGGPATAAQFNYPYGVVLDHAGNLYISDYVNRRIRMVNAAGIISTFAGTGVMGFSGDGGPATAAQLGAPGGLGCDAVGNIFVADAVNRRVRKIDASGIISTVAGNSVAAYSGDGGLPTLAGVSPFEVAIINDSSFYCTDAYNSRVRFVGLPPCSGVPTAGTLSATTSSGCGAYSTNLSLLGTTAASRIIYKWQSSTDNIGWAPVIGATNATYTPTITAPIYYRCVVTCNASGFSDTTNSLFFDNPVPVLSPISGVSTICPGATTTYTDTAIGGTWNSSNLSVATINTTTGLVNGIAAGTATISYAKTNACGTTTVVQTITVNPLSPNAGTITGTATVCPAATTSLSNTTGDPGGAWTSLSTSIATIGASTGIVTGVTTGTATISYTVSNGCGTSAATRIVSVNPLPFAGSIIGVLTTCPTTNTTLSNATGDAGGVWTSVTPGRATIGVATGIVTGVSAGTSTISYTVTNGCGTTAATAMVTVNPSPNAGAITGTATVCPTATTSLSNTTGDLGGAWTSLSTAIATVGVSTGMVTGVAAGTATVSYTVTNSCGTVATTRIVTVNPLPYAGAITGTAITCPMATTSLSNTTGDAGGIWTSVTPARATVGGATGIVTGVSAGTSTISYTATNSCGTAAATTVVTVNPSPNAGAITGTATVCPTASTSLSNATGDPGGVWTSLSTSIATVGASTGIVTGVTTGTATISYTVTNSCGTAAATRIVTVNPLPNSGAITGTMTTCPSGTSTLSNPTSDAGGVWASTTIATATINASTGLVSGVAPGTTTISYTATNSCGTSTTSIIFTVNLLPNAGAITGTATVCPTATTTLSNSVGGGVWSSSTPAKATISAAGIVTGISAGTTTISYTVTNICGTAYATEVVTVNPLPDAGTITGTSIICQGLTTTLSNATTGGVWSSTSTGIATVGISGIVTGIAAGTSVISYSVTNSCGTAAVTRTATINPLPAPIAGIATVCIGATTALTDTDSGGTWSKSNTNVTIGVGTGIVTGIAAGTVIVTYTLPTTCITTATVTVNPLPLIYNVTGGGNYCGGGAGVHIGLSGSDLGITYQLYNAAATFLSPLAGTGSTVDFGTIAPAGVYTVQAVNIITSCTQSMSGSAAVTVDPFVVPSVSITPSYTGSACSGAAATFVAGVVNGGTSPTFQWYVNGSAVGTPANSYSYIPTNGDIVSVMLFPAGICVFPATATATHLVSVLPTGTPAVNIAVSPGNPVCLGNPVIFAAIPELGGAVPAYLWVRNGINVATGSTYTYVPATGDVVFCKMTSNYICRLVDVALSNTVTMTVQPAIPAPTVNIAASPGTIVSVGQTVTLTATAIGGTALKSYKWAVNGTYISGATNSEFVRNTFSNGDIATCEVSNNDLCANSTLKSIVIHVAGTGIRESTSVSGGINLYPNPNNGIFVFNIHSAINENVHVTIFNLLGEKVKEISCATNIEQEAHLNIAQGLYLFTATTTSQRESVMFVVQ